MLNNEEIKTVTREGPSSVSCVGRISQTGSTGRSLCTKPPMASNKEGMASACRKRPAVGDQGQPKKVLVLLSTLVLEQCQ